MVSQQIYILSKGIINAFLTGFIVFLMVFLSFILASSINYSSSEMFYYEFTFSQLLSAGDYIYVLIYSLWVSINAVVYSTITYLLLHLIRSSFIALLLPFLFYHIFNFISGVLGVPEFSPISTIFPFNIVQQPLWTVLVPFSFLLISLIFLFLFTIRNLKSLRI